MSLKRLYQLRVVASDAGAPPKTSTSTLTIRGEGAGVPPAALSTWHGPWGSGRRLGAHAHHCCPLSRRHRLPCRWAPSSAGAIRHSRAPSVSTKSEMPAGPSSHLVTAFRVPEPRGSGLDPLLRSPFLILAAAERACSGWRPRIHEQAGEVQNPLSSSLEGQTFYLET